MMEKEEEEILPPIISENKWTTVSLSNGKQSGNKGLVYSEVRIATPSRFEVLRNQEEENLFDDIQLISST